MSAARKKGTSWETAIVTFLRSVGVPHAERRALAGNLDRGDIAGVPGIVFEAKSGALHLAAWIAEAETERRNDGADFGIVWAKRPGKTSPGDGYAILTGAALVELLRAAGYIAPAGGMLPAALTKPETAASDGLGPVSGALLADLRALIQRHDPASLNASTIRTLDQEPSHAA
ncbi:hypothetical protein ACQEVZ_20200 [Dactylosporangium sp. CA-152071]|uniref:hypothetical protein n=1 Tax=Dactylosporangium sp. CA-152071 TaxID=3239933 RepID=UPI003D8E3482